MLTPNNEVLENNEEMLDDVDVSEELDQITDDTQTEDDDDSLESLFDDEETEKTEEKSKEELDYDKFLESLSEKIKYNKENYRPKDVDELVTNFQKGMNYDKIHTQLEEYKTKVEDLSTKASFLEEMAKKFGFENISEYQDAVKKAWEQEEIEKLVEQNIPESVATELLESRKFREEYQKMQEQKQQEEKEKTMMKEFIEEFPDVKPEEIPKEVWEMVSNGKDLTSAYALYKIKHIDDIKQKVEQETVKKISKNDKTLGKIENVEKSEEINSVEQVNSMLEKMSPTQRMKWIDKNMEKLEKMNYFEKIF